jgi:Flp pilus assembly protein TadG
MNAQHPLTRRKQRGAATVEFAICLPVLLLFSFSLIELCSMMFVKQSLTIAAYEAAHTAVQPSATSTDAIAVAEAILIQRRVQGAVITVSPENLQQLPQGQYFTVRVVAPANLNRLVPIPLFVTGDLAGAVVAMKEVPAI